MEGDLVDPLELNKYPKIIKEAQTELGNLDILVCGQCHMVFHFVEQFQDHRLMGNCSGSSSIRENNINESKAQVWAFLLWKGAQNLQENENSWVIYQRWCKMDAHVKEAWIVAGRNVQVFTKLSAAKMQEVRAKTGRPKNNISEDPLEEGEIKFSEDPLADSDEHSEGESELDTEEEAEKEMKKTKSNNGTILGGKSAEIDEKEDIQNVVKKIQMTAGVSISAAPKVLKPQTTLLPANTEKISRLAKRTDKVNNTEKECAVEKILAKRFNPRRKLHEYLIKWEGCPHEQNTWEPPNHLDTCKHLVEAFERNLARQKEAKAAAQAALVRQQQKIQNAKQQAGPSGVSAGGRSQRASKQRALDQVKQWCGNISDRDDDGGHKRKAETDSDDDMDEKKIKMEMDSGSEDEWQADESEIDRHTSIGRPKILQKTTSVLNGIAKKQQMTANEVARSIGLASPDRPNSPPVFLANSKGVVKVYKNQMPNLATGVYIMSKKDGIVKLESSSNLLSNSNAANIVRVQKSNANAQNIIRVAAKSGQNMSQIGHALGQSFSHTLGQSLGANVGQTQVVRMVQKGASSDNVRLSPGMSRSALMTKISPGRLNSKPPLRVTGVKERLQAQRMQIGTPQLKVVRTVNKPAQQASVPAEPIALVAAAVPVTSTSNAPVLIAPAPITMAPKQIPSPEPEPDFKSESSEDEFDPFPKNLPPVEPDSPPREFTLDPLTGLIVGQAEGEPEMQEVKEDDKHDKEDGSQDMPSLILPDPEEGEQEEESETTTITLPEGEEPLMITGEDGVVYQVAGQNEAGQTLLVAQGADGQQQCVYVTTTTEDSQTGVLTLDSAVSEALGAEDTSVTEQTEQTSEMEPLTVQTEMSEDDDSSSQVVAQLVKAELPSPGGTRKVVLLLPDGNLLMTEVDAEQYASLELDK